MTIAPTFFEFTWHFLCFTWDLAFFTYFSENERKKLHKTCWHCFCQYLWQTTRVVNLWFRLPDKFSFYNCSLSLRDYENRFCKILSGRVIKIKLTSIKRWSSFPIIFLAADNHFNANDKKFPTTSAKLKLLTDQRK